MARLSTHCELRGTTISRERGRSVQVVERWMTFGTCPNRSGLIAFKLAMWGDRSAPCSREWTPR